MNIIHLIYFTCRLQNVCNLNYAPTPGYKVGEKLHVWTRQQERLNTAVIKHYIWLRSDVCCITLS
jgi:hypothetical protein